MNDSHKLIFPRCTIEDWKLAISIFTDLLPILEPKEEKKCKEKQFLSPNLTLLWAELRAYRSNMEPKSRSLWLVFIIPTNIKNLNLEEKQADQKTQFYLILFPFF